MLDPFELIAVDQDAIEAAVAIGFAEQVVLGGQHNAAALAGGDARPGAAEVAATSLADFNKNQCLAVAANQVDLAATDSKIARNYLLTAGFQITRRPLFGFAAARGGGIVGLCLHVDNNDGRIRRIVCRPDTAREPS